MLEIRKQWVLFLLILEQGLANCGLIYLILELKMVIILWKDCENREKATETIGALQNLKYFVWPFTKNPFADPSPKS